MNIHDFQKLKNNNKKITFVTCYDFYSAKIVEKTNVDAILIGDSSAMVMHGFPNTVMATTELMVSHTEAVARGIKNKFIVADLPFLSYRQSLSHTIETVKKFMQAGAHAIKLEGTTGNLETIKYITESGVPVMGHIGLTPQYLHALGGHKVQGKTTEKANKLCNDALALQEAGCFAIVLECIPWELAQSITEKLTIPTIGIGAGPYTSGQILVLQDLLGMQENNYIKFVKKYLDGFSLCQNAINTFVKEVENGEYPNIDEHCYNGEKQCK